MKNVNYGIDLGTTNSLIAKYENGEVVLFKNPVGFSETLPSVVAYRKDRILIGNKAKEYITKDAINVFSNFKRKMGTDEKYYVVNIDENVTPIHLSSLVIKELKNFLIGQEKLEACVLTIPASFDTMQSNATLQAGKEAGLQQVFLLQEPIAASLAYFNQKNNSANSHGKWLVYDLGGGTFDVSLVQLSEADIKVIDSEGNNFLGGVDFDFLIIQKIIIPKIIEKTGNENFETELFTKYGPYEKLLYQLLFLAEETKIELSLLAETEIEFSAEINDTTHDFIISITIEDLNTIFRPKVKETIKLMNEVLSRNNLSTNDIEQIVLVGGSTYLPIVREELGLLFPSKINTSIDPTTAIAVGAAYYASTKYYQPLDNEIAPFNESEDAMNEDSTTKWTPSISIKLNYNSNTRDEEELLIINCDGDTSDYSYRIIRKDGGFDTGMIPLKNKKSEFLNILSQSANQFSFKVYNHSEEINSLAQIFTINHGKYSIDGQPIPHDICIEIDDIENNSTKLEIIFEKNSILPQKRTLYREITKTIKKGSTEKVIISILEGDRNARPASSLTIGCIEINGKQLDFDLLKGSDIEIQLSINESRILSAEVFLVMTKQEFTKVFTVSEKIVHLDRLKEQAILLDSELKDNLDEFVYTEEKLLEIETSQLLDELKELIDELRTIPAADTSDRKYIIAESLRRIAQKADKLGGNNRIEELIERYLNFKDYVFELIQTVHFDKNQLLEKYNRVVKSESSFLKSRNTSVIESGLKQMEDVHDRARGNTIPFLIECMEDFQQLPDEEFKNPNAARKMLKQANTALDNEKYLEFKQNIVGVSNLVIRFDKSLINPDFKGTGIG
jgi:molecular chaperone DnaK